MRGLDSYLTTEPDDGFNDYYEYVCDKLTEEQYSNMQDFLDSALAINVSHKMMTEEVQPDVTTSLLVEMYRMKDKPKGWSYTSAHSII